LTAAVGEMNRVAFQPLCDDVGCGQRHHVAAEQKARPLRVPAGVVVPEQNAYGWKWVIGHG
jgi:hypothetical protein